MRVLCVLAHVMEGREIRRLALGHSLGIGAYQLGALLAVQLARQGQHHLVEDAGVLPIADFGLFDPRRQLAEFLGHPRPGRSAAGARPSDVAQVRGGRERLLLGALSD